MTNQKEEDTLLDEIFEELDDNLSNAPGKATEIGWEQWDEEKQEYIKKAKQAIEKTYTKNSEIESMLESAKNVNLEFHGREDCKNCSLMEALEEKLGLYK